VPARGDGGLCAEAAGGARADDARQDGAAGQRQHVWHRSHGVPCTDTTTVLLRGKLPLPPAASAVSIVCRVAGATLAGDALAVIVIPIAITLASGRREAVQCFATASITTAVTFAPSSSSMPHLITTTTSKVIVTINVAAPRPTNSISLTQSLPIVSSTNLAVSLYHPLTNTVAISSSVTVSLYHPLTNTVTISTGVTVSLHRSLTNTVAISSSVTVSLYRSLTNTVAISTSVTVSLHRSLTNTVAISTGVTISLYRSLTNTVTISSSVTLPLPCPVPTTAISSIVAAATHSPHS
jgi:hypothetical protein